MPNSGTVWLTPLDELTASLERAGLEVMWIDDLSRAHSARAQALARAYAAEEVHDLVATHRLWARWLDGGRARKLALVAKRVI
jgi:hypothetical protein